MVQITSWFRFVIGRWIEKYDPTIEESYQTTVDIDGKALQVEILDTAGQDEYTPLRETFMIDFILENTLILASTS